MKYKLTVMSLNIYMLQENKSVLTLAPTTLLRQWRGGGGWRTGNGGVGGGVLSCRGVPQSGWTRSVLRCTWAGRSCSWPLGRSRTASRCGGPASWRSARPSRTEGAKRQRRFRKLDSKSEREDEEVFKKFFWIHRHMRKTFFPKFCPIFRSLFL